MQRILPGAALAALGVVVASTAAQAGGRPDFVLKALAAGKAQHAPQELIVQHKRGAGISDFTAVRGRIRGQAEQTLRDGAGSRLELLRKPAEVSVASAARLLDADPAVEFVEPNRIHTQQATPDDIYYTNGSLWGMNSATASPASQFGSGAARAWASSKQNCGTVWIGIMDEGCMHAHADLAAKAGKNPGEVDGNGVGDDSNGYVEDVHGWDFAGGDVSVFDGLADDQSGHVAGTIGRVGGNGAGVAGLCWSVKMIKAKFTGPKAGRPRTQSFRSTT